MKRDAVKHYLLGELQTGRFRFGQRISVTDVVDATGASRFVVSSALNELQNDGFVEITPQVGCNVIAPTEQEVADFFVMFGRLEGVLAAFAAERRTAADIAELRAINERLKKLDNTRTGSGEAYRLVNQRFHWKVHDCAHSELIVRRQQLNWMMTDFFVTQVSDFQEHADESASEHDLVVGAIDRHDAYAARTMMEAHIARLGQNVIDTLKTLRAGAQR